MKFMRFTICFWFLLISTAVMADVIILENGLELNGKITLANDIVVKFIPAGKNQELEFKKDQVLKIQYETPSSEVLKGEVKDYKSHYPVFGVVFPGTPAGLNFMLGYYSRWVGFHVSGGYLGKVMYGAQANLLFSFYHSRNAIHGLALVGGFLYHGRRSGAKSWYYAGLAYNMNIRGFFLEVGLTGGKGDYPNPQFIFQLGYVHRFNRK